MNCFSGSSGGLSPNKRALLQRVLQQEGLQPSPPPQIARRPQSDHLPLSFAQQRLWFLEQWEPARSVYTISRAFSLSGTLHMRALARSLREIVDRHEALRTTFALHEGKPVQVIAPTPPELLTLVDLTELPEGKREAYAQQLAREQTQHPFDLTRNPLIRVLLLRLSSEQHILILSIHHSVCDGWSLGLLLGELSTLYPIYRAGQPSSLPALPLQYADYTLWQSDILQDARLQRQLIYWRRHLEGAPVALNLPTDHPHPAVQSYRGDACFFDLSRSLSQEIQALSKRHATTLFMTLLAALQVLLFRYSGQTDIVIGTPVAGRSRRELEGLIGLFINTLALRTDLSGNPSFSALLERVREVCLQAYTHQDAPFEKVVEAVQSERSLSHHPLFQVMFQLQNAPTGALALEGLLSRSLPLERSGTKFDLTVEFTETPNGLHGVIEYNTDLFERATIERLIQHYQHLLEGIIRDANQRISSLPLLGEEELQRLLVTWNATSDRTLPTVCIHQLFEAQVLRHPDAIALTYKDQQLTFAEVDRRANQIAHMLQARGVLPEVCVGIYLARTPEMVMGVLGVLKAGGAYVPLDSAFPVERLAFILHQTRVALVLTQHHLRDRLPAHTAPVLCLDSDWPAIAREKSFAPTCAALSSNLAYVIYTSGSTGAPKGVQIEHRGLTNYLSWCLKAYAVAEGQGSLLHSSLASDLTVTTLFAPLLAGRSLVIVPEDQGLDALGEALCQSRDLSLVKLTPAHLLLLAEQLRTRDVSRSTHALVIGGEALLQEHLAFWRTHAPETRLINEYGPTETVVGCCVYELGFDEKECADARSVPIGRPIANTQLYLLDQQLQPVPIGVPGELYIGGIGVARGYLHQPELTAECFLPDQFSQEPGRRLYRTGDRARYQPDGTIEFLGRNDTQVKLRGYRVELGEIEAVLRGHTDVQEAVVQLAATRFMREEDQTSGEQRLVAYLVKRPDAIIDARQIRSYLRDYLPDYMLPTNFVILETLPLSPNGKVNRQALPAPNQLSLDVQASYVAPRSAFEELLTGIWTEVLRLERVGMHDNFFEIGGHSLVATQVVARLREALQQEVPLRSIFEAPTIAGLAQRLENRLPGSVQRPVLPLHLFSRPAHPPLSFAQQRLWFLAQLEPSTPAYNLPIAMRLSGRLEVGALKHALDDIVERHEVLRTTFALHKGSPIQRVSPSLALPLPVINLSALAPAQREMLARQLVGQETRWPFDLTQGPLLRVSLLRLQDELHLLLLTMHHIIMDGWSLGVLLRELSTLYRAHVQGEPSPLPALPVQYLDYTLWQQHVSQREAFEAQLRYWKQHLQDAPPTLELPTNRLRPAIQTFAGAHQSFTLAPEISVALVSLSRRAGVTLFMTLLSAFACLLWRYSGQDDLLIGTPIANRRQRELEDLIGFFVNTLVLRVDIADNPTVHTLLARVREITLQAYAHQDVPFEQLVETLAPERVLRHTPLVQIMFSLQHASGPPLELAGLNVQPLPVDGQNAKFDLTLSMQDTKQGLEGTLHYNSDLFEATTIERMATHFQQIVEGMIADPEQNVGDLPLLTEAERQLLLVDWNATRLPFPHTTCLHQHFESQVERTPSAIALVCDQEHLSYQELNQRANQLAHRLRRLGVGPEVVVGVCLPRSLSLVIGLLAILKAGGAYLPLDPDAPAERLRFMIQESQAPLLLTQSQFAARLPDEETRLLCLDAETFSAEGRENLVWEGSADQLAYVIYTSGSTGTPKGSQISHRSLLNLLFWHLEAFGLSARDRATHLAGLGFDAATWELWPYLLCGACVCLLDDVARLSASQVQQWLARSAITISFLPTPLAEQVVPLNWSPSTALRLLLVGGDRLHQVDTSRLPFVLINNYGPTEYTVVATSGQVLDEQDASLPAIGRPIANTQVYVLDARLLPVPQGVEGELYLAGEGLARGYMQQPALTAERFVPNPFSPQEGQRLYRTGDRVRFLPDGRLQFLGRGDSQVKVRGYRIELGEIETHLRQHEQVQETVVVLREDRPGDLRLVGYIVARAGEVEIGDLRAYLERRLPAYMVPAALVVLERLPLSLNGKLERTALPAPDWEKLGHAHRYVEPQTPVEELLAKVWAQVLGLEQVGIHDNFFELGGHSLLATQMISRVRDTFRMQVPLQALFAAPTVAGLAEALVKHEVVAGQVAAIARLRKKIDALSPEERQQALQNKEKERKS